MSESATHLLVIGEREALAWILRNERMAFPKGRFSMVSRLQPGDTLLLLTTRGCYHNPGRDRTLLIGTARVETHVKVLDEPVSIAGRTFPYGCRIAVDSLAPRGQGVLLAPLVDRLRAFPMPHAWSATLRRPLISLSDEDTQVLMTLFTKTAGELEDARLSYLDTIRPVQTQARR